jgi:hypothetical protein
MPSKEFIISSKLSLKVFQKHHHQPEDFLVELWDRAVLLILLQILMLQVLHPHSLLT